MANADSSAPVQSTQPAHPKLNPFLFPSDTDFRFVLLILSVLGASLFIYYWINIPVFGTEFRTLFFDCLRRFPNETPSDIQIGSTGLLDLLNQMQAQNQAQQACFEPIEQRQATFIAAGAVVLLAITAVIYWTMPHRKIKREGLMPLTSEDAPEVVVSLAELCGAAGIAPAPEFVWNPLSPSATGIAFGRLGKYYVGLGGGLVTQFYTDAPAFRAVLLHELSHLKNGDVDKTYLAVAIWQAFVIAALIPFALSFVWALRDPGWWGAAFQVLWRAVALATFVFLMRNATLRARELYADARASATEGASSALRRVLNTLVRPMKMGALWLALVHAFSTHPHPQERVTALDGTERLFRFDLGTAFAIGLAATVALPAVDNLLSLWLPPQVEVGTTTIAVAALIAFAVAALCIGIWRGAFAALMRGGRLRRVGSLGLAVGIGMWVGLRLALSVTSVLGENMSSGDPIAAAIFDVALAAILLVSLVALAHWSYAGASAWLEVTPSVARLRAIVIMGLVLTVSLGVFWLGQYFAVASFSEAGRGDIATQILLLFVLVGSIAVSPWTVLAYAVIWAFPLAAWLWRRGRRDGSWAYLNPDAANSVPRLTQAPLRPRLALLVGVVCGLAFCVINAGIRLLFLVTVPEVTRATEEFRLLILNSSLVLVALIEVIAAIIVALIVPRLRVVHGVFAAFVAGCVAVIGFIVISLMLGGTFAFDLLYWICSQFLGYPALLVLIVVSIVAAFANTFNRGRMLQSRASE